MDTNTDDGPICSAKDTSSLLRSETVITAVVVAQDGKLPAKSPQSDKLKSRLSKVEKLLRDESQLKFLEWKFVTTPLDELELAYEFSRWMGMGTAVVHGISSISEGAEGINWKSN